MFISYQNLKMAATILGNKKLVYQSNREKLDKRQHAYNCWNFTAFTLGWTNELEWFSSNRMNNLLKTNSYPVSKKNLKAGDIVVYRSEEIYNCLDHTALILDPKKKTIIHKDGSLPVELNKYNKVYQWSKISFRRPKKKIIKEYYA